jgi:hypothetical protein
VGFDKNYHSLGITHAKDHISSNIQNSIEISTYFDVQKKGRKSKKRAVKNFKNIISHS